MEDLMEEKTLSGVGPLPTAAEEPVSVIREPTSYDESPDLAESVAAFDLAAWVRGITPLRHSVRIYGDLDASEGEAAEREEADARKRGASSEELRQLIEVRRALAKRHADSALDVVIEARTADFINRAMKDIRDLGLENPIDMYAYLISEQVVQPADFTFEIAQALGTSDNPGAQAQFLKLVEIWRKVNEEAGVKLPF